MQFLALAYEWWVLLACAAWYWEWIDCEILESGRGLKRAGERCYEFGGESGMSVSLAAEAGKVGRVSGTAESGRMSGWLVGWLVGLLSVGGGGGAAAAPANTQQPHQPQLSEKQLWAKRGRLGNSVLQTFLYINNTTKKYLSHIYLYLYYYLPLLPLLPRRI